MTIPWGKLAGPLRPAGGLPGCVTVKDFGRSHWLFNGLEDCEALVICAIRALGQSLTN